MLHERVNQSNRQETHPVGAYSVGDYRALIIGITEYDYMNRLPNAARDAKQVSEKLKERYGFKIEEKDLLLDKRASFENINEALSRLAIESKPSDSVLIYYAGHGEMLENKGFWLPVGAEKGNLGTYIRHSDVVGMMSDMKARHVLFVSDSCFSGTFFYHPRSDSTLPPKITDNYYLNCF